MSTLYETTKPVYTILKYCGFLSYTAEKTSTRTYLKPNHFHLVISSVSHLTLMTMALCITYQTADQYNLPSLLESIAFMVYSTLDLFYLIFNIIVAKFYNDHLLKIFNTITDLEFSMLELDINLDYHLVKVTIKYILGTCAVLIVYFIYFISLGHYIETKSIFNLLRDLVIDCIFFADLMFFLKYAILISTAKHILRCLNSGIHTQNKKTFRAINSDVHTIKQITKIYQNFFQCLNEINSTFSVTLLLMLSVNFSAAVVLIFNFSSVIAMSKEQINWDFQNSVKMLASGAILQVTMILIYAIPTEIYLAEVKTFLFSIPALNGFKIFRFAISKMSCSK